MRPFSLLFVLATLLALAFDTVALAQPVVNPDASPITAQIVPEHMEMQFSAPSAALNVKITLEISLPGSTTSVNAVVLAGGENFDLVGANQTTRPTNYLLDLTQRGFFDITLAAPGGAGNATHYPLALQIKPLSWGYLVAEISIGGPGEIPIRTTRALYFAASEHRVVFGRTGLEDIVARFTLRRLAQSMELIPAVLEVKRLRERGKFSQIESRDVAEGPHPKQIVMPDLIALTTMSTCPTAIPTACTGNPIVIKGKISFAPTPGRPVSGIHMDLLDETDGDRCKATTSTDDQGDYQFCLNPAVVTEKMSVRVSTFGEYAIVAPCAPDTGTSGVDCLYDDITRETAFAVRSEPFDPRSDNPSNIPVTKDLPADDQWNMETAGAFGVYEAINLASRTLQEFNPPLPAGRTMPKLIFASYGNPSNGTRTPMYTTGEANINVSFADQGDWDVIHHEFGHLVQHFGALATMLDGIHRWDVNHCTGITDAGIPDQDYTYGKDKSVRLAWTEGWAGWFSFWIQQGLRQRFDPTYQPIGDFIYQDRYPLLASDAYNIEDQLYYVAGTTDPVPGNWPGEANEVAVQRVLWDIMDGFNGNEPDRVSLGDRRLWKVIADNTPEQFSDFISALLAGAQNDQDPLFSFEIGEILAVQGIAPESQKAGKWDWLLGTRELRWMAPFNCMADDPASVAPRFDVTFAKPGMNTVEATLTHTGQAKPPTDNLIRLSIPWTKRFGIFGLLKDRVWSASVTDLNSPQTGPYPGTQTLAYFCGLALIIVVAMVFITGILVFRPKGWTPWVIMIFVLLALTYWLWARAN